MSRTMVPVRVRAVGLIAAASLALGGLASVASAVAADVTPEVVRISGADRYEVSARVAQETFEPGVPVAYVATGTTFPDALSGAAAAGTQGGPVLLVRPSSIPEVIATELDRLNPENIVVLGGPVSVSAGVEAQLAAYTEGAVTRIAGANRYDVSAAVSAATFPTGVATAYVATGASFPDALSGAAPAGSSGSPVLLVPGTTIPSSVAAELNRLAPSEIVILGGTASVSSGVAIQLESYTDGTVTRIAGANRYEVSASLSASSYAPGVPVAYVATGKNFPDALSGAPAAAAQDGPVLLVDGGSIPAAVAAELERLEPARIVILGGTASVGAAVSTALDDYLVATPAPTEVCGEITEDVVWRGEVTVTCWVDLAEGVTVSLGNGARVTLHDWIDGLGSLVTVPNARNVEILGADGNEQWISASQAVLLRNTTVSDVRFVGVTNDCVDIADSRLVRVTFSLGCRGLIERNEIVSSEINVNGADPSGVRLVGAKRNLFTDSTLDLNAHVQSGNTFELATVNGLTIFGELTVSGTTTIAPGSDLAISFQVAGELNINGTEEQPVTLSGGLGDAVVEVSPLGATVTASYTTFNARTTPAIMGSVFSVPSAGTPDSVLEVTDSVFRGPVSFEYFWGRPILERNVFALEPLDPWPAPQPVRWTPLKLASTVDPTGIVIDGSENSNSFERKGIPPLVDFGGAVLPEGTEWGLSSASGALFAGRLDVEGGLHAAAGTIFRSPRLRIGADGVLSASGTSDSRVIFTTVADYTAGGEGIWQSAFVPEAGAPYIEFLDSTPARASLEGPTSALDFVEFRRTETAMDIGQWVDVLVDNSTFTQTQVAVTMDAANGAESSESPWASLPCAPPFTSVVTLSNTWFAPSGLAGVAADPAALDAAFGDGPLPVGLPESSLTVAQAAALQDAWSAMEPVTSHLAQAQPLPARSQTVPYAMYSCEVEGGTISFPWLPVRIGAVAGPPF